MSDFVRRIRRDIDVERAILFGSRAKGTERPTSDYDLILVSRSFEGKPFYERPVAFLLLWDRPEDLELLCYTPAEFQTKLSGLNVVATAVQEGIEVAA